MKFVLDYQKSFLQKIGGGADNKLIGRCHCGGMEFDVPALLDFITVSRCNCSFCRRRAAVMVSCAQDLVKIQQGICLFTLYQWNTHTAPHYFCKICGIYTFHQRRTDPSVYGIDIGCFDDLDYASFQDVPMEGDMSLSLVHR